MRTESQPKAPGNGRSGVTSPRFPQSDRMRCFRMLMWLSALLSLSSISLNAADADYLMIQQGNEWIFDMESVHSDGTIERGTARIKISDKVERGGHEYLRLHESEQAKYAYDSTKLVRVDESGFYQRADDRKVLQEERQITLPLKVGNTLQKPFGDGTIKTTVLEQEKIIVNGKHYERCFHIRSEWRDGSEDIWLAPWVGMVKLESKQEVMGNVTLTLREFKAGKAE